MYAQSSKLGVHREEEYIVLQLEFGRDPTQYSEMAAPGRKTVVFTDYAFISVA